MFIDLLFVFFAASKGKDWLYSAIILNLILIEIFGAKLISSFGIVTNVGNVYYASAFLATYFLLEKYGKREALRAIWLGAGFSIFFAIMAQLITRSSGLPESGEVNIAIDTLFKFSTRVTVASILGYIFAQAININIYEWLKNRNPGGPLWLRVNTANVISQLADSLIFFTIAFFDLAAPLLLQAILIGWVIKVFVVLLGTPLLYINEHLVHKNK